MLKRKIADCIDVLVNLGPFNHIQFTKYAEEEIEFDNDEERIAKEDSLRNDLVTRLLRDMDATTKMVGKGIAEVQKVEEAITEKIPEWLSNDPLPNIANVAKKKHIQDGDNQEKRRDDAKARVDEFEEEFGSPETQETQEEQEAQLDAVDDTGDLFEDDELPAEPIVEEETDDVCEDSAKGSESQESEEASSEGTDENKKEDEQKSEDDLSADIFGSDDDIFGGL